MNGEEDMELIELLNSILFYGGEIAVLLFEILATFLVFCTGVKGITLLLQRKKGISLMLLKGFSVGLTFLLGAEVIKTIVLANTTDLLIVGGIVLMRVALSVLVYWEMEHEKHSDENICDSNQS